MGMRLFVLSFFVFIGVLFRFIPHPANFTPVIALALFAGASFGKTYYAAIIPLLVLFLSDLFLGFHSFVPVVYGAFLIIVLLGTFLKQKKTVFRVAGGSLLASFLFFFITNFAVWIIEPAYAKNFEGLVQCFVMALPFFKNTLSSTLLYSAVFFGCFHILESTVSQLQEGSGGSSKAY